MAIKWGKAIMGQWTNDNQGRRCGSRPRQTVKDSSGPMASDPPFRVGIRQCVERVLGLMGGAFIGYWNFGFGRT